MEKLSLAKKFSDAKEILEALSDEVRQDILVQLSQAPNGLRVSEIRPLRKLTRPCLSHHIKLLYRAHLIDVSHDGKKNYYHLVPSRDRLDEVLQLFENLKCFCKKEQQ